MKVNKQTREMLIIFLIIGMIVLLSIGRTSLSSLNSLPSSNLVIFAVFNLNVVLLILVIFLVIRNVGKLLLERKKGVLGSRLRA